MPKLTLVILTISLMSAIGGWVVPATANPTRVQSTNSGKVSIALTGKRCTAARMYSRSRYRR